MIIQNLFVHDVLGKRKISLEQIRRGLETLDVHKHLKYLPDLYEPLFIYILITPRSIVSLLKFNDDIQHHDVVQYLQKFVCEADTDLLEDFLVFATASKVPPALSGI